VLGSMKSLKICGGQTGESVMSQERIALWTMSTPIPAQYCNAGDHQPVVLYIGTT